MIITDLTLRKIDHSHPRYPDPATSPMGFLDVYLLSCEVDGHPFESAYYVTGASGDMSPQGASDMLRLFASAIVDMGKHLKAA